MSNLTSIDGTPVGGFAFGAMQFGGAADEPASREMFDACRARGIVHFDTAYTYTGGASETFLGRFAAAERESLFIATKANFGAPATRASIEASVDESRRRLGMDTLDALYMHRWDDDTPLEETFETLARLQSDGAFRHIGVSNYAAWQVMKAQAVAASMGTRIELFQPMYNLVKRQAEVEILPMAMDQGISVFPYSPLGGGLLTGKYLNGGEGRLQTDDRYTKRYGEGWMHLAAGALADLARDTGHHPATLAVAWAARHPGVTAPILSARSLEQLEPSLAAMDITLDDAAYAALTALSPTPPPATDRLEEA